MSKKKHELPILLDAPLKGVGLALGLWIGTELSAQFMSAFTGTDVESTFSTLAHSLYSDSMSQSYYEKPVAWGTKPITEEWSGSDRVWFRIFAIGAVVGSAAITAAAIRSSSNSSNK